ncbi:MAG: amidohydrolase [Ruminococcaceae bacterium]|nr:amidohydrolase [Oscillospiraceae bacterium]
MSILIKNVILTDDHGFGNRSVNVLVENKIIKKITEECITADEIIDGRGDLLIPGFYNTHCHAAMTALRGYADDLPLDRWLFEKIFPAEDKLTERIVACASELAVAEMIRGGVVSFSDMYFFMDETARAAINSGIKLNLSRGYTSDANTTPENDFRFNETLDLLSKFNGAEDGRIIVDMCIHGEYTNAEAPMRRIGEYAKEHGLGIQIHVSETQNEHEQCIARHGMTPIAYFESLGVLDASVCAAHCVKVTDGDIAIMAKHGVSASHNPVSNLKLGSGIMPVRKLIDGGVNVALGTDGASSNNRLDLLREMQLAALLHKGAQEDPTVTNAREMLKIATENGAMAQGRSDCGRLEVGYRADLVLISVDELNNIPLYDKYSMLAYSARSSDVRMNMVDGRVLYLDGEFKTLDVEKIKYESKRTLKDFFI